MLTIFAKLAESTTCASSLPSVSSAVAFVGTSPISENFVVARPSSASAAKVVTSTSHTFAVAGLATIMVRIFAAVTLSFSMVVKAGEHC